MMEVHAHINPPRPVVKCRCMTIQFLIGIVPTHASILACLDGHFVFSPQSFPKFLNNSFFFRQNISFIAQ